MSENVPKRESLWCRWVVNPVLSQLSQGTQPKKIAQAAAFGVTLGLFPILGSTTLLTLIVGIPLKLNQPILHLFRELSYPLHLATILLFIKAGESLFGVPHHPLSIPVLMEKFWASPGKFMADFGMLGVYGICVWVLIAPVIFALIYFTVWPLTERAARRFTRHRDRQADAA